MTHIKSLIGCAWFALVSFGGSTAWSQQPEPPKGQAAAPELTEESAWLHGVFFREISEYQFYLDAKKRQNLVMRGEPALRFPTPTDFWGEIYLWTDRGRAAVIGSIFEGKRPDGLHLIFHEFHSLSPKPLVAHGGSTGWQPEEEGIKFAPIPDAAEPAKDAVGRLKQMRDLADRFHASMVWLGNETDLHLLSEPFYRYELTDEDSTVVDGALFAHAAIRSNDPEVIVVIEAQRTKDGVRWHYAPVRFTNREAWLKYKGEEVWRVDAGAAGIFDGVTTKRYGVFNVKSIRQDVDEK